MALTFLSGGTAPSCVIAHASAGRWWPITGLALAGMACAVMALVPGSHATTEPGIGELRIVMLDMINEERVAAGLNPVVLGNNSAAQAHADDMLENCYAGHWGLDGLKPHMRYSLAGGYQKDAENVSGLDYCLTPDDGFAIVSILHEVEASTPGFMDSPGHRYNILDPHHTTVSIGIAWDRYNVMIVQHFEYGYMSFYDAPRNIHRATWYPEPPTISRGILSAAGITRNGAGLEDFGVDIYYDQPPHELTRGQVARTFCYDLGDNVASVRPAPPPYSYYATDTYSYPTSSCPDPYDVNANVSAPASYAEAHAMHDRARQFADRLHWQTPYVEGKWYDAHVWNVYEADRWKLPGSVFDMAVDISDLLDEFGPGAYTMLIWGTVNGEPVPIMAHTLFHGVFWADQNGPGYVDSLAVEVRSSVPVPEEPDAYLAGGSSIYPKAVQVAQDGMAYALPRGLTASPVPTVLYALTSYNLAD